MSTQNLSDFSMLELFRIEVDNQAKVLTTGLLALEKEPGAPEHYETLMRAAHSVKGAARIVNLSPVVKLAHVLEDCFVAAQRNKIALSQHQVDHLLGGVDLLLQISQSVKTDAEELEGPQRREVEAFIAVVSKYVETSADAQAEEKAMSPFSDTPRLAGTRALRSSARDPEEVAGMLPNQESTFGLKSKANRTLRVTADSLNRLLSLAGEALVESRGLKPFGGTLLRLRNQQTDLVRQIEGLRRTIEGLQPNDDLRGKLSAIQLKAAECHRLLGDRLIDLDLLDRRSSNLAHRLYEEALACRMRPISDGIEGFPRMVRDIAHSLGKQIHFEVVGPTTAVDRDVLEKLESTLGHLLRNAVDHGIEVPEERRRMGKPVEGHVRFEAFHNAGMLQIVIADDGQGINLEELRQEIIKKKLATSETVASLGEMELYEFLFLPGFTLKESITEISGRGVGLDAVQNMVRQVRGSVRVSSEAGRGTRFQLSLPLTLSLVRALLVEIDGEPYAFPLACLEHTLRLPKSKIQSIEGCQHFDFDGRQIALISAAQILGGREAHPGSEELAVLIVGDQVNSYGVAVDRFLCDRELVVQPLDPRLGKIKDISSGAVREDGSPVLIIDVEDFLHSIKRLATNERLRAVAGVGSNSAESKKKRVLVVDDSLTVRELERKLLRNCGYEVEVAVDGIEGWNAVRSGKFDLVISDVDMPRMDGIELVTLIRQDPNTKAVPVMILSYKDRDEDRSRGLEAGADYYLTKASFHDETLLTAVADLIGSPSNESTSL